MCVAAVASGVGRQEKPVKTAERGRGSTALGLAWQKGLIFESGFIMADTWPAVMSIVRLSPASEKSSIVTD